MTPSDILSQLIAVFIDWPKFLKDPQYVRNNNEITWANATISTVPERLTKQETAEISRNGQFTFRISEDNSIIQINYRFHANGGFESARLAFYEVGSAVEEEEIEVQPVEGIEDPAELAKWVRFDYRHTGLGRVLHIDSHLHISGFPGTRFAVTGIPTPRQFVEFIASHFYPQAYHERRLTASQQFQNTSTIDSVNSSCLNPQHDLSDVYRRIPHFRIPAN